MNKAEINALRVLKSTADRCAITNGQTAETRQPSSKITYEQWKAMGALIKDMDDSYAEHLKNQSRLKRRQALYSLHLWWDKHPKLIIGCAILFGLLGARQLNTVPDRNLKHGSYEIRKVDDLFGSTYHLYRMEQDPSLHYDQISKAWYDSQDHPIENINRIAHDLGESKEIRDLAFNAGINPAHLPK